MRRPRKAPLISVSNETIVTDAVPRTALKTKADPASVHVAVANASSDAATHRASIVFVHIPKTGGTAITRLTHTKVRSGKYKYSPKCSFYHIPPAWFVPKGGPYAAHTTFALLRSPYDRAISNYRWSCWGRRQSIESVLGVKVNKHDVKAIRRCQANVEHLNNFSQFMIAKTTTKDTAASFWADCHYVPQAVYAAGVDHVFCDIEDLRNFLLQHGLDPQSVKKIHPVKPYNQSALADATKELVASVYSSDFDLVRKCESSRSD